MYTHVDVGCIAVFNTLVGDQHRNGTACRVAAGATGALDLQAGPAAALGTFLKQAKSGKSVCYRRSRQQVQS